MGRKLNYTLLHYNVTYLKRVCKNTRRRAWSYRRWWFWGNFIFISNTS